MGLEMPIMTTRTWFTGRRTICSGPPRTAVSNGQRADRERTKWKFRNRHPPLLGGGARSSSPCGDRQPPEHPGNVGGSRDPAQRSRHPVDRFAEVSPVVSDGAAVQLQDHVTEPALLGHPDAVHGQAGQAQVELGRRAEATRVEVALEPGAADDRADSPGPQVERDPELEVVVGLALALALPVAGERSSGPAPAEHGSWR